MSNRVLTVGIALALMMALSSCTPSGPKPIALGASCAGCGMSIGDLRFACERQSDTWSQYDSIECLLDDPQRGVVWLADYDSQTLAPSESCWVVLGDFPSPMGGGLASFRSRVAAERVAAETHGRVARWPELKRKASP
jgi:nitrous oxide reductase accessory protein NosL